LSERQFHESKQRDEWKGKAATPAADEEQRAVDADEEDEAREREMGRNRADDERFDLMSHIKKES
jgi:hypothetical protein